MFPGTAERCLSATIKATSIRCWLRCSFRVRRTSSRESLFSHRLFGGLIASLNAFPVRRGRRTWPRSSRPCGSCDGKIVIIFPEGTRTSDGRIGFLLPGAGAIAKKARVPLVPTLIDGMVQTWPRGRMLPGAADVIVEYDKPLMPEEYAGWPTQRLMAELRDRLVAMQCRWHTPPAPPAARMVGCVEVMARAALARARG